MSTLALIERAGGVRAAARALGVDPKTIRNRRASEIRRNGERKASMVRAPSLIRKQEPIERVLRRLEADARRSQDHDRAQRWARIQINDPRPIGILWFGDPHLGTHTDWRSLRRDVDLCAETPGLYGANIGDVSNNWVGALMRKYADEDISKATERQLAKWFLADAGVTWLVWLMGNHDEWNEGATILRQMDIHNRVTMLDWVARLELRFPGKQRVRIHAAHDFPGHSMWSPTHGPSRAAQMLSDADLYVAGHRHTWGVQQYEMPERGRCPVIVRAAGYKRSDEYARRLGFPESQYGASVLTIIDPTRTGPGRVTAFPDPEQGAYVLRALRR